MTNNLRCLISMILVTLTLFGCNGDDIIGTGVQGLKLPARINFLEVRDEKTTLALTDFNAAVGGTFSDPGTDYSNDTSSRYSAGDLQESMDQPNDLLCLLNTLRLDEMVNKGPYKAILTKDICNPGNNDSVSESLVVDFTVITERKNNQSPQSFKVWYRVDFGPSFGKYVVVLEGNINANESLVRPIGDFSVAHAIFSVSNDSIKTDRGLGSFSTDYSVENESNFNSISESFFTELNFTELISTTFSLRSDENKLGNVLSRTIESNSGLQTVTTLGGQFDDTNILQGLDADQDDVFETNLCLSRSKNQTNVGAYNLYHQSDSVFRSRSVSAGERLKLSKGKLISYDGQVSIVSTSNYWLEIPDAATVSEVGTDEKFLFYKSPGKLSAKITSDIPLSKLENVTIIMTGKHPNPSISRLGQWVVNVVAGEFYIVGKLDRRVVHENNQPIVENNVVTIIDHDNDLSTPELSVAWQMTFNDGAQRSFENINKINSYTYRHQIDVPASERIISQSRRNVNIVPTDSLLAGGPVTLYCYRNCPIGGIDQSTMDNAVKISDLYYNSGVFSSVPFEYVLTNDTHKVVLTDMKSGLIVDASDLTDTASISLLSGYRSGFMVTEPLTGPNIDRQLIIVKNYYQWRTGNTPYSHLGTLVDGSGNDIIFGQEISIDYQHDAANDRNNTDPVSNPYHGNIFQFFNDSLPTTVDINGNRSSLFSVLDGTSLPSSVGKFVTKAKWITQSPTVVDANQCGSLSLDKLFTNPSLKILTATDIVPVTIRPEDKPIVLGPPAIINGTIQTYDTQFN